MAGLKPLLVFLIVDFLQRVPRNMHGKCTVTLFFQHCGVVDSGLTLEALWGLLQDMVWWRYKGSGARNLGEFLAPA